MEQQHVAHADARRPARGSAPRRPRVPAGRPRRAPAPRGRRRRRGRSPSSMPPRTAGAPATARPTTLPALCPPSTRRCASTMSSNGTIRSITGTSPPVSRSSTRSASSPAFAVSSRSPVNAIAARRPRRNEPGERHLHQDRAGRNGREVDAVGGQRRTALPERALADGVEDDVVRAAGRREVLAGVVDHPVGAERQRRAARGPCRTRRRPSRRGASRVARPSSPRVPEAPFTSTRSGRRARAPPSRRKGSAVRNAVVRSPTASAACPPRRAAARSRTLGDHQELGMGADSAAPMAPNTRSPIANRVTPVSDGVDDPGEVGAEHRDFRGARSPKARRANHGVPDARGAVGRADRHRVHPDAAPPLRPARIGAASTMPTTSGASVPFVGCDSHDAALLLRVGVLEDVVERHPEHPRDLEGHLERGRVAALLDGDDGLAGHPEALRELGLGHLAVGEPQRADVVGDPRGLHHVGTPRR